MTNKYLYLTLMAVLGFQTSAEAKDGVQRSVPRLVVNIAVDQLRTDYLEAFAPLYGAGGLKRLLAEGMVFANASFPFAPVDRASAIAAIATGTTPYYNSIVGQKWLNRETLRPVGCVDDPKFTGMLTHETASPAGLATSTLGDELKVATEGKSQVFAIAPFRDAAILSAGHAADGAFWIDDETGRWTTSQYYLKNDIVWLQGFNDLRSPAEQNTKLTWEPVIELSGSFNYYQHIGNQKPFKHKLTGSRRYIELKSSGLVNAYVTDMAQQVAIQQTLGFDRVTDMLSVTYYAGNFDHKAMTECQLELQDTYVRLDREIARLIKGLQQKVGDIVKVRVLSVDLKKKRISLTMKGVKQ